MSNTEAKKRPPSRGHKHSCVPFASEAHSQDCVEDVAKKRQYLTTMSQQHPELFPQVRANGYTFHDRYQSRKQRWVWRRIKLKAPLEVCTLRPSFLMPSCIARTDEIEQALYLRQWGVPVAALAYVFGREARLWYRAWLSCGRPNLVGTTVTHAATRPQDLVAEEKSTWLAGAEVVVPTTVGGGCVWGLSGAAQTDRDSLKAAYGEVVTQATTVFPAYRVRSVCTEGVQATRAAWRRLVPQLILVRGFLHALLNLTERGRGTLRHQVLERAWSVSHAVTKAQFAQRLRRLGEWARTSLDGSVAQTIAKRARHRAEFLLASDCPQAARTTNAGERVHNQLDRVWYALRYCHGQQASARWAVRAGALQWNFHP